MKVDNATIAVTTSSATVEPMSSHLAGPTEDVANLLTALGATLENYDGDWYVDCGSTLTVTFSIGGKDFDFTFRDLVLVMAAAYLSVLSIDLAEPRWIVGNVFMWK